MSSSILLYALIDLVEHRGGTQHPGVLLERSSETAIVLHLELEDFRVFVHTRHQPEAHRSSYSFCDLPLVYGA